MDEDDAREIKRRTLEWGNLFYAPVKASAAVLEELALQLAVLWRHVARRAQR